MTYLVISHVHSVDCNNNNDKIINLINYVTNMKRINESIIGISCDTLSLIPFFLFVLRIYSFFLKKNWWYNAHQE